MYEFLNDVSHIHNIQILVPLWTMIIAGVFIVYDFFTFNPHDRTVTYWYKLIRTLWLISIITLVVQMSTDGIYQPICFDAANNDNCGEWTSYRR